MKYFRLALILLIILIITAFLNFTSGGDPQVILLQFLEQKETNHFWIILIIFSFTLLSTIAGLPVLYLVIVLGFLFGFLPALGIAWLSNLISIMVSYLLVKGVFSEYFLERYGDHKLIKSINKRIKKYGFWTVAISRSIYIIPTNLINFSLPLSKISFRPYLIGTMIGLLPECLINVTAGHLLKHQVILLNAPEQNLTKIVVIGVSLILIAGIFIYLRYRSKRRNKKIQKIVPLLEGQE